MFGFGNKKSTSVSTDAEKISHLLTHNVEEIFVKEELEKKLKSGKCLRVKLGFDPTSTKIHIGRAITLWKLKEFQDLGHQIVFLVGNFTAQIGDASDKLEKRPMLTKESVNENLKYYLNQAGKILDISKVEVVYNADWLEKLNFKEIVGLAESFSVNQMLSRRNFKERYDKGDEISLREFLYPLMQGFDSVKVDADVEIGGFDQLFNLKAGRVIQKHYEKPVQDILTTVMLEGTDGRKMSSSWGNIIALTDEPNDMYGKVLALHDDLIVKYFSATTHLTKEEISEIEKGLSEESIHPKDAKKKLAREIVKIYHGEDEAKKAEESFEKAFEKGGAPDDIETVLVESGTPLVDVLLNAKLVASRGEFKRLISENAVKEVEGEVIKDIASVVNKGTTFKVGKRRFLKVDLK